jgi:3-deoxy-D-manno-octulosonic-acid transferase
MSFIYNYLFMPIAGLLLSLIKLFNPKFKKREQTCLRLLNGFKNSPLYNCNQKRIWFHAASMGEFEQAKPIIELIKKRNPEILVFVSFFSPSGYENQKNYPVSDYLFYLPFDIKSNARKFIKIIKPDIAVFIRYEIWLNYLIELNKNNKPAYLANATAPRSRKLNLYYKKCFPLFKKIFTMNPIELGYFTNIIGHNSVRSLWDTRFDRINEKVEDNRSKPLFNKELFGDRLVFVCGSTWSPDEDIIIPAVNKLNSSPKHINSIALIIIPHQPTAEHISELKSKITNYVLLSKLENEQENNIGKFKENNPVIIVDSIGKLLRIYANANIAYVGGAFGVGVHSVTEPAGYGIPVAVGTKYSNSPDAIELEKITVLKSVRNSDELYKWLLRLSENQELIAYISNKAENYVKSRCGSSELIYKDILEELK